MKTISKVELDTLKEYLGKRPFRYEEVYNEVIDHYATAYEQSDLGLYEVIREQDKHFTDKKINEIDKQYLSDINRQINKAHLGLFIGYFKWPQLLMTLSVAILFFIMGPLFMAFQGLTFGLFLLFFLTPYAFMAYVMAISRKMDKKLPGKIINGKLSQAGRLSILSLMYFQINQFYRFLSDSPDGSVFEQNMYLTSTILLVGFAICWSCYQLFRLKFKPVLA